MTGRRAWWVVLWLATPAWALNGGLGEPPADVDRLTPLATVEGFLKSAHAGRYGEAAQYLWLDHLPPATQAAQGPKLARRLRFVLDHQNWLDLSRISKSPEGDPQQHGSDELGVIPVRKLKIPIRVVRVRSDGEDVWVFDRETVGAIDSLYEKYGPPFGDAMPEWLTSSAFLADMELWQWIGLVLLTLAALVVGRVGETLTLALARKTVRWTRVQLDQAAIKAGRGSLRIPLFCGVVVLGAPSLLLPPVARDVLEMVARSLAIASCGWFGARFVDEGATLLNQQLASSRAADPFRARGLETQIAVLRRLLVIGIYLLAGAALLLQFQPVRNLGLSLLASAGVAGLVLGFAAQKSLATVLAGIQLSLSQPIRIGDKVMVETEFGTIEEIRLTYVVVLLWDLRRLVVPITYFLEKPFQNWSKSGTQLLGAVTLQVDYTADVDAFRREVERILGDEGKKLWDGKVQNVQVVDATERTQTLRVLASARDSGDAWDLRCVLREQLIRFLRANPRWMPTQRTLPIQELQNPAAQGPNEHARVNQLDRE